MSKILPPDATFLDLTAPLPKREEYLRRVVQNLDGHGAHRGAITVRIGVAGHGISYDDVRAIFGRIRAERRAR